MQKDVMICIRGMQGVMEDAQEIESIYKGTYYQKNDCHYVLFEEIMEGFTQVSKNRLTFKPGYLHLRKRGPATVDMEFQPQKESNTCYTTPYGDIMMGILTKRVEVSDTEEEISIEADYDLSANYEKMAQCQIRIKIVPASSLILVEE